MEAQKAMLQWIVDVTNSVLNCFNKFKKTLNNNMDIITNYFISRNSSGFVEGFNNRVKVLKGRCYGLSNIKGSVICSV